MRLLLTIRFLGTRYHGWQVQPNGVTVQQVMQDAIEAVTGTRAPLTGCSRTDAGVHAEMFCCCTDTDRAPPPPRFAAALNAHLPRDIAVLDCRAVPDDFHPRYAAAAKEYTYRIRNHPVRDPFAEGRVWHIRRPLDVAAMQTAAAVLVGEHDFSAFCAAGGSVTEHVRRMYTCTVTRDGDTVSITAAANGFLYNMVRIITGTLVEIGSGRRPPDEMAAILQGRDRAKAGATAPPEGLYLSKVFYELPMKMNNEQ